jgi:hypothetical protein
VRILVFMIILDALAAYALCGIVIGVAFVVMGLSQVMPHITVTPGARFVLLPGTVALWPLVLGRWVKSRRRR